jgi:hypothetical protein
LSYRWGHTIALTTTLSTLKKRIAGIELKELPYTLRHAVLATRWLGMRYIWIDALCIIQDSAKDWKRESANMANIYANAYVNLSADRARDTDAGFLNRRFLLDSSIQPLSRAATRSRWCAPSSRGRISCSTASSSAPEDEFCKKEPFPNEWSTLGPMRSNGSAWSTQLLNADRRGSTPEKTLA